MKEWEAFKVNTSDHGAAGVTLKNKHDSTILVAVHDAGTPLLDSNHSLAQVIGPKTALSMAAWLIAAALEEQGKTAKDVQILIK